MNELVQPMLHMPLDFEEEPRNTLDEANRPLRVKQVVFVNFGNMRMDQVGGQNELRFDQRKCETQDDDECHGFKEWPHDSADKEHRRESGNCCENAECCRDGHAVCPLDDVVQGVPVGTYLGIGALADDDRVIDDDTEHDDETEQADRVDRDRPGRHQPQSAEEADRQAYHHPESDFHTQEQGQHDEHEQRAIEDVALHTIETFFEILRQVDPCVEMNAARQGRPLPLHVFLDHPGRFDFVLIGTGDNLQSRIRFAVEATERL